MKKNVFISIDLTIREGKFLVQTFNVYPVGIKPYFLAETNIKRIVMGAIGKLYLGDMEVEEFNYDKTKQYDDLSFSVYYRLKKQIKIEERDKEIENFKKKLRQDYFVLKIEEDLFIKENLIAKCETCVFNKEDCPFRKGTNGIKRKCKDYIEG